MNQTTKKHRPFTAWILIFLMLVLGIGGIVSGPMLFLAPDGHLMQWSPADLAGSPFINYLIPGIILFIFIGVFPFIVSLGLMMPGWKGLNFLNPFKAHYWPWTASIAAGVILLIWIITETAMLGYISFLQPVMGAWGILILLLTTVPSIRKYYRD
jgi:hypothetical protein